MRISDATRLTTFGAAAALAALGLAGLPQAAAIEMSEDAYDWSATLMSFDRDAGTATLQARFESYVDIPNLDQFSEGDRLTLIWTGRNWAAGIRGLAENPEVGEMALTLPIEFVGTARDDAYLNFRVRVPESAFAALEAMEPGARVTGISPKSGARWDSAVLELRHYNDID